VGEDTYYPPPTRLKLVGVAADAGSVNRCRAFLIALAATLLLLSPTALGATRAQQPSATVHVRHQTIHRPAHVGHKHKRRHHKHTHHNRHTHHKHKRQGHTRTVRGGHRLRHASVSVDCLGATLTPSESNLESVAAATLCLVNDERARFGEPALIADTRLSSAAAEHSRDMDARDYFEHVSPGGETLLMRIRASGFIPNRHVGYTLGENIALGTLWLGSPRAIVRAWMASPGHRANILDRSYRYTGVGVDPSLPHSMSHGQPGGMYTQDFGTIASH
jgi:uncharacterized protein YkwD